MDRMESPGFSTEPPNEHIFSPDVETAMDWAERKLREAQEPKKERQTPPSNVELLLNPETGTYEEKVWTESTHNNFGTEFQLLSNPITEQLGIVRLNRDWRRSPSYRRMYGSFEEVDVYGSVQELTSAMEKFRAHPFDPKERDVHVLQEGLEKPSDEEIRSSQREFIQQVRAEKHDPGQVPNQQSRNAA